MEIDVKNACLTILPAIKLTGNDATDTTTLLLGCNVIVCRSRPSAHKDGKRSITAL
jgi:hypothetical protein